MSILLVPFAVLARLFRPTNGVHTSPLGYLRELVSETSALRRRSSRVRRYAVDVPTVAELPRVPAPRKPADDFPRTAMSAVPVVGPLEVQPQAALVRGHYVAHEQRQAEKEADQQRLGVAVLVDIAETVGVAR